MRLHLLPGGPNRSLMVAGERCRSCMEFMVPAEHAGRGFAVVCATDGYTALAYGFIGQVPESHDVIMTTDPCESYGTSMEEHARFQEEKESRESLRQAVRKFVMDRLEAARGQPCPTEGAKEPKQRTIKKIRE